MLQLEPQTSLWINNYNTDKSRQAAITSINSLYRYLDESSITISEWINDMKSSDDAKYQKLNLFCKSLDLMPASVRQYYAFVKSYLRVVHGIKTDIDDQKQYIKFKPILKIEREPLTREIIKELCTNSNDWYRAFWLVQSSSGMRISESLNLRKEDFDFSEDPAIVTIPADITKTSTERITFISKEAVKAINNTDYFNPKTLNIVEGYFWKLRSRLDLLEKYENSPNYKINIHSLRAFTRTNAGKINQDFAESLLGHEGYLRQYVRLTKEEKISYYKKLEPKLRIFN